MFFLGKIVMEIQTYVLKEVVKTFTFSKESGEDIKKLAVYFSTMLAIDKGIGSEVRKVSEDEYVVIADDGKGVKFKY